jgi:hypothetical protein
MKESSRNTQKRMVRVRAARFRQMTQEEERRLEAVIDAWLTVLVQRYMNRQKGELHEPSKHQKRRLCRIAAQ